MDYNKKNCAECNFYVKFNHGKKKVFCVLENEWREQYDACSHWTENATNNIDHKIKLAEQKRKEITEKEINKKEQQKQIEQQNKLSWRQIIAGFFSGLIIGLIIGLLF